MTKPTTPQIANAIVSGWLAGLTEDQQAILSVWDQRALEDLVHAALDGDLAFAEQIISEEAHDRPYGVEETERYQAMIRDAAADMKDEDDDQT